MHLIVELVFGFKGLKITIIKNLFTCLKAGLHSYSGDVMDMQVDVEACMEFTFYNVPD